MSNDLTFNGKSFSDFSAYIATSNFLDGAAKDVQSVSIAGRSGALQLSNGKYNNLTLNVRMYITQNMQQNMREMRSFLESCWGYCRYEETQTPNEFRMASFKAAFVPDVYDVNVGVVDLTFDSMPQRFLKSGETTTSVSSESELFNPTLFESKPIIRVWGNGSLQINSFTVTVANSPYEYVDIDCELMDCYYGSNNANQYVSFSTTDYVTLRSGTNYFSYSGFTQVEITPRWFEV